MGCQKLFKVICLSLVLLTVGYLTYNVQYLTTEVHTYQNVEVIEMVSDVVFDTTPTNDVSSLHIGVVVTNHSSCSKASLLVKSILMYCHSPIHFHFITDSDSMTILETLIDSWELPFVNTSFYTLEYLTNVTDFGTRLTSASVDALKLVFPLVLPPTVSQIVILNANIVVATDIEALWDMFEQIENERKVIGLTTFPQQNKLDTRIMLLDMQNLDQLEWFQSTLQKLDLESHTLVERLPNKWSLQRHCLGDKRNKCIEEVMVFIWDPENTESLNKIVSFNGYELQDDDVVSGTNFTPVYSNIWDWISPTCSEFRKKVTYRTHPYYTHYSYQSSDPYDVTMVTQLSFDRLHTLQRLIDNWDGPIGATIYMRDSDTMELLRFTSSISRRKNVAIHIVYKKGDRYPINYLRNVAWNYSNTPYVFLNDADLMPSPNMYQLLKQSIKFSEDDHNIAFVIPAFETHVENLSFPENKLVLEGRMLYKDVIPFKWDYHKQAQRPTNYKKWMESTQSYSVHWSEYYEPYIVVHYEATRYDERFAGYGQNKVSQIEELHAQKYAFIVLPDVFVIHYPHPASKDESNFRGFSGRDKSPGNTHYYRCIQRIHKEFHRELRRKYGHHRVTVPLITLAQFLTLLVVFLILGICHMYFRTQCSTAW